MEISPPMIGLVSTCPPHWYPILMSRSYRGSCPRSKQHWPSCGVRVSYCAILLEHFKVENLPATAAPGADHSDRRAGESDSYVEVLEGNPEQRQNRGRSGVARRGGGVAALNGAGAARGSGGRASAGGDSDGGGGKSQGGKELELHDEERVGGLLELFVSEFS